MLSTTGWRMRTPTRTPIMTMAPILMGPVMAMTQADHLMDHRAETTHLVEALTLLPLKKRTRRKSAGKDSWQSLKFRVAVLRHLRR